MLSAKHVLSTAIAVAIVSAIAWFAHATMSTDHPSVSDRGDRSFVVSVMRDGEWHEVGSQPFGRFYVTREYELGPVAGELAVRIAAREGGAAHLDAVLLAGQAAVDGSAKLASIDSDVIDGTEPVRLTFVGQGGKLAVTGRIEPTAISKTPFQFPRSNTFSTMTTDSQYYTYEIGSRPGRLAIDGELSGEKLGEPFFAERIYCDSGHPQGLTYGWVRNDDTHLYVAIDFTPDNTLDGEADYAKVYVRRGDELIEHAVTVSDNRWGKPGFTYTERVGYQHKTYELAIPLAGIRTPGSDRIELAFATYGTASAGMNQTDPLDFDLDSQTFALIYWEQTTDFDFKVQRFDVDGATVGVAIDLGSTPGSQPFSAVAADTLNGSFLVAWEAYADGKIYGRRVFPNGTVDGSRFDISTTTAGNQAQTPRVAFDSSNDRWLVVWTDERVTSTRYLYGRFVGSDGVAQGSDLTLHDSAVVVNLTGLAYNPQDEQFLVAYGTSGGGLLAKRIDASNGSVVGTELALGDGANPDIAFSEVTGEYLVAWTQGAVLRGRTVAPDGTMGTDQELMAVPSALMNNVAVVAHHVVPRFAVIGDDYDTGDGIWARYVDASDGSPVGNAFAASAAGMAPDWNGGAINTVNNGVAVGGYDLNGGAPFVDYILGLCFAGAPATTVESGSTAQIDVRLCAAPTGDVVVDITSEDTGEGTVSPASLTFTTSNWQTTQPITVTPVTDSSVDGDVEYLVSFAVNDANSADEYDAIIDAVRVTNTDVDVPDDGADPGDPGTAGDPGAGGDPVTGGDPATGGDIAQPGPSDGEGGCDCRAQRNGAAGLLALLVLFAGLGRRRMRG